MFTTRIIDKKEKEYFNNFIEKHSKGHFLQTWEWGQVKKIMGWEPLPLVLEENGEIKAAMLILKRTLPIPLLKKCILYAPRGPVVDTDNEELCKLLFATAKRIGKEHGAIFLKIDPDIEKSNSTFHNILIKCGLKKNETGLNFEGVQPNFVFRMNIVPSEDELLANMHSKTRYNVRVAMKKGVTIREARGKEELKDFYEVLEETAIRDKFSIRSYEYFAKIWDEMVENNYAKIFFAEYEGKIVSGTLAMILGEKTWYLYGASSNTYRNVMPNYLIQWEMIRWARQQGCTLYDFRGVSGDLDESNPLYGLYRFKKGFNGDLVEFIGEWDEVYSRFFYFLWNHGLPIYQSLAKLRAKKEKE